MKAIKLGWIAGLLLIASTAVAQNSVTSLTGAGVSSFDAMRWGSDFAAVDYLVMKSEEAVTQVKNRKADFAVTDYALLQQHLEQEKLLQFPIVATAIVPIVNIPGIKTDQLHLSGPVLAEIMSGEIKNWNSKKIRAINPNLSLPSLPITRIVRAEASGATLALTKYLSRNSKSFNDHVGVGRIVNWPDNPKKTKDEDDTISAFKATDGAISYIEMVTGNRNKLPFVSLRHVTGQIVKADISYLGAGVLSIETNEKGMIESGALTVVDLGQNWPVVQPIYVVIPQVSTDDEKIERVLRFFILYFNTGDSTAEARGYVALPTSLQAKIISTFRRVRSKSGAPLKKNFNFSN